MAQIESLLALCAALEGNAFDPLVVQRHVLELRHGIHDLSRCLAEQAQQIQRLTAQRSSLEEQVMFLAQLPEPSPAWWQNTIVVLDIDEADLNALLPDKDTPAAA
jgi:hypothetical protein